MSEERLVTVAPRRRRFLERPVGGGADETEPRPSPQAACSRRYDLSVFTLPDVSCGDNTAGSSAHHLWTKGPNRRKDLTVV